MLGLAIAGPRSRELLARVLAGDDVSNAAFPFLSFRAIDVGMVPAHVGRISFTGELGYEIWVPPDCQLALYDALVAAGADLGLRHFGARALNSLRLEKSFGTWAREYRPIYTPARSRARPLRRSRQGAISSAATRRCATARRRPARAARHVRRRCRRRRRDRRRAGVARRQGRRLDHVRRLRPLRRQVDRAGLRAGGARDGATAGFEIEILGERRRRARRASAAARSRRGAHAAFMTVRPPLVRFGRAGAGGARSPRCYPLKSWTLRTVCCIASRTTRELVGAWRSRHRTGRMPRSAPRNSVRSFLQHVRAPTYPNRVGPRDADSLGDHG